MQTLSTVITNDGRDLEFIDFLDDHLTLKYSAQRNFGKPILVNVSEVRHFLKEERSIEAVFRFELMEKHVWMTKGIPAI